MKKLSFVLLALLTCPSYATVYDLDVIQLIKTVKILETGVDLAGKKLNGSPKF